MKRFSVLFMSLMVSLMVSSCFGGDSSSDSTPAAPAAADSSTRACMASVSAIDSIVGNSFASISSASVNVSTSTYTMSGTRSGVSGNYTYTLAMTFTNRTFTFKDDQGTDVAVSLIGACQVVYNNNTTTKIETYTITPAASDDFVITYGGASAAIKSFNIVYTISNTEDKITGNATVNGSVVNLNFTW